MDKPRVFWINRMQGDALLPGPGPFSSVAEAQKHPEWNEAAPGFDGVAIVEVDMDPSFGGTPSKVVMRKGTT